MIAALLTTFALVFVAELGDKTQLLVAWLATRYPARKVLAGVFVGSAAIHGLGVVGGVVLGELIPRPAVEIAAGLLFLLFGILAIREARRPSSDGEQEPDLISKRPILGTASVFFVAEIGDKTQLAVVALAAQAWSGGEASAGPASPWILLGVWIGAVMAMTASDGLAVLAGTILGDRIRRDVLAIISGVLFLGFGVFALASVALEYL